MNTQWLHRKLRWRAPAVAILFMVIVAAALFVKQEREIKALEKSRSTVREAQLILQNERSDKLREIHNADSPEYLAEQARSNGYLLPGEIRFEITNLDELMENGGDAETEIAEEGT